MGCLCWFNGLGHVTVRFEAVSMDLVVWGLGFGVFWVCGGSLLVFVLLSVLVLQSSSRGRESWLIFFNCLPVVF